MYPIALADMQQIAPCTWEIPRSFRKDMRVNAISDAQMEQGVGLPPHQGSLGISREDDSGNWFRSYGNENWEFDEQGLMRRRIASINDLPIKETERKYHWP